MKPTRMMTSLSRDASPINRASAPTKKSGDYSPLKSSSQKQNVNTSNFEKPEQDVPKFVASAHRNPLENVKLKNYIPRKSSEERVPKEPKIDPRLTTHPGYSK